MATKNNKSNPHIVWSNYDLNLEDWREGIEEMWEMNEIDSSTKTEDDYIEEMYLLNSEYFHDEQAEKYLSIWAAALHSLPRLSRRQNFTAFLECSADLWQSVSYICL